MSRMPSRGDIKTFTVALLTQEPQLRRERDTLVRRYVIAGHLNKASMDRVIQLVGTAAHTKCSQLLQRNGAGS